MATFVIIASLLTAAALLFLLPPLLSRPRVPAAANRNEVNVAVYREQLADLEAASAAGQIDGQSAGLARDEVARRLLEEDSGTAVSKAPPPQRALRTALLVALLVPTLAAGLYMVRGRPEALRAATEPGAQAKHQLGPAQIRALVQQLQQKLEKAPADTDGWLMLARSQLALGDFAQSANAFARAALLQPRDASLLADYADVLAMAQGKRLAGAPEQIIAQALAVDPNHPKALALAGTAAFERQDYARAIEHWQQAQRAVSPQSSMVKVMESSISDARRRMAQPPAQQAAGGSRLVARIDIDAGLRAQLPPRATVFVFARADDGSRAPIAIVRRSLEELPVEVILDDAASMNPARRLSGFAKVVVAARASASGQAQPQPGDLEGVSEPVPVNGTVEIRIDRVLR